MVVEFQDAPPVMIILPVDFRHVMTWDKKGSELQMEVNYHRRQLLKEDINLVSDIEIMEEMLMVMMVVVDQVLKVEMLVEVVDLVAEEEVATQVVM